MFLMAGHCLGRVGVAGVMLIMVGIILTTTDSAIARESVSFAKDWGEWQPWVICTGEYCGLGKRSRKRNELVTGQSQTIPGPLIGSMAKLPDPPEGTTSQADADYELFSPSCPVKDSIPGSRFQTISALGIAALANASEDIGTFLEIGCDPNFNQTFLTYIETECESPIFEKLGISCAREVTVVGFTPLILAVLYGTPATVQKLSEIPGIYLDDQILFPEPISPLWGAASRGNIEMVRSLVEAGANLEISGGLLLTTPLTEAVKFESVDMVRYLISKGANIASSSASSSAPYAATLGNLEILKILQSAGADLDGVYGEKDETLLIFAVANNQADIVDYLISQRVDVNKQGEDGKNALFFAAIDNNLNILQSLVGAGADLNVLYEPEQLSTLSFAIGLDKSDIAHFLIKSGADVNTQSSDGFTAAFIAAEKDNLAILEALADAGANLETKGGSLEMPPLLIAALMGHLDIVKYLTAKGVNLQATNNEGRTALDLAREFGNDGVVKFLEEQIIFGQL